MDTARLIEQLVNSGPEEGRLSTPGKRGGILLLTSLISLMVASYLRHRQGIRPPELFNPLLSTYFILWLGCLLSCVIVGIRATVPGLLRMYELAVPILFLVAGLISYLSAHPPVRDAAALWDWMCVLQFLQFTVLPAVAVILVFGQGASTRPLVSGLMAGLFTGLTALLCCEVTCQAPALLAGLSFHLLGLAFFCLVSSATARKLFAW